MKKYKEYKNSGIDWVGDIPEAWQIRRIRYLTRIYSGVDRKSEGGRFPLYGANGVIGECDKYSFSIQHILIGRVGSSGEVNYAEGKYGVSDNCLVLDNSKAINTRFLFFITLSFNLKEDVTKNAQPLITASNIKERTILFPDFKVQQQIANYLDHKTTQIDNLIAKKEQMIEFLKEERTAIINQAVAKGLDPKVEMKDSGIEWLGKVPKHWDIKRLRYVVTINPQRPKSIASNERFAFIPMESMNSDGTFDNLTLRPFSEVKSGFTYFAKGDVIFAKITPCFENGKGALLHNLGSEIGFGSTEFHVLRAIVNKTTPRYLYFLTISGLFRRLGEAFMQGVAGQKRVTNDFVQDFIIGVPSIDEQKSISSYLEGKIKQIDTQISRENKLIEYLKEYRTALISEVVTGKIDVRGLK